jgi:selenocysteine-specific elongation factor
VRGIQKNGDATNRAQAGERCALNLVGVTAQECKRGDWVVATVLHAPTQRLDVSLTVLPSEPAALTHWIAVHVHTGTTEVMGRIAIEHAGSIEPGTTACAQLVLEHPIACLNGDRLIVRDQSARRTIGGGIVLDPFPPVRIRNKTLRRMQLAALAKRDPASALSALLTCHAATGVDMDHFSRSFNLTESATNTLINLAQAVLITKAPSFAFSNNSIHTLGTQLSALLQRHHQAKPEDLGMSIKDLRQQFAPSMKSLVFLALLRHVSVEQKISITGTLVSLEAHRSEASAADQLMWQKIQPVLSTIGPKGVTAAELAQSAKLKTLVLNEMLHRKVKQGELFRVSSDRFYLRAQFIQFAQLAAELAGNSPTGTFIAAKFRDRIGVNRTLAIEILDVLDRLGVTLRVGDARKLLKPIQTVFHLTSNIHAAY